MPGIEAFQIRPAEAGDEDGVRELARTVLCEEYGVQEDLSADEDLRDVASSYAPPGGCFLLAEVLGEIVATAGIRRLSRADCELRRLYVRADHRRQGLATSLVARLIPFVKQQGYRRLLLEIRPEMESDSHIYPRYGFRKVTEDLPRDGTFMAIPL